MANFLRISLLFILLPFFALAEEDWAWTDQARIQVLVGEYTEKGTLSLGIQFELTPGWKVYWRTPGDAGFPPRLHTENSSNLGQLEWLWPAPKRDVQDVLDFTSESYVYQKEVIFPIDAIASDPTQAVMLDMVLEYAICKDVCIPGKAILKRHIRPGFRDERQLGLLGYAKRLVPLGNHQMGLEIVEAWLSPDESKLVVIARSHHGFKEADLFVEAGKKFAFYQPEIELGKDKKEAQFIFEVNKLVEDASLKDKALTLTLVDDDRAITHESKAMVSSLAQLESQKDVLPEGILVILLFAFIGGLILNVMPCVLPVLSIKIMSFIKHGAKNKGLVRRSFLATAGGIVLSFLLLSVLVIILKYSGMQVGWGFHFQEPLFVIFIIVILSLFAANMWGLYEIHLPGRLGQKMTDMLDSQQGYTSHMLSGAFATLLATPCSAPFLGSAVAFALAGHSLQIVLIFFAMGLGLAFPYLWFAFFPRLVTLMPKPGAWMVVVRHVLGYFLAITAIWLIWVLSNQLGNTAAILVLVLLLLKQFKLWLSRYIPFLQKMRVRFVTIAVLIGLAFILPLELGKEQNVELKNSVWQPFDEQRIATHIASGKTVFVDVTADWCLTCKANKFLVLDTQEIQSLLAQEDVVAMQADWTNKDATITDYLMKHKRAGIPFNVVYSRNLAYPIVLSELLTKEEVIQALEKARGK